MSFEIREAGPGDVAEIVRLVRALAAYEKLEHEVVATEAKMRQALFGGRRVAEAVLGWSEGRAVGLALYFHNFSTFRASAGLYLEDLFVEPEQRGKGYGKALLLHLAGIAAERGCERMEWSVLDWNQPAIGFYRSLGAVVMDDWRICRLTGEALSAAASANRPG
ncbi:MAG TPA: GNAT family N-acetyltransferase [Nevskia sp.]|nr:GNAT family N-acetyltransferase [Nevskia sp.]